LDTKEKLIPLLKELPDTYKKKIKHIQCDNAGENNILEKQSIEEEMGILFKYTTPGTPQQNSIMERVFPAMFGKLRAMMNAAGFDKKKRDKYWREAALTLTLLENVSVKKGETEFLHGVCYDECDCRNYGE